MGAADVVDACGVWVVVGTRSRSFVWSGVATGLLGRGRRVVPVFVGAVWIACPMFASVQNLDFSTLKKDARCGPDSGAYVGLGPNLQNLDFSTLTN